MDAPHPCYRICLTAAFFFIICHLKCLVQSFLPGGFWVVIARIRECLGAGNQSQSAGVHTRNSYNPGERRVCRPSCLAPGAEQRPMRGLCSALPRLPSQVALGRPVDLLGDEASCGSFPFRPLPGAVSRRNYLLLNPQLGVCFWGNPNQDNIYTAWNRCSLSQWELCYSSTPSICPELLGKTPSSGPRLRCTAHLRTMTVGEGLVPTSGSMGLSLQETVPPAPQET